MLEAAAPIDPMVGRDLDGRYRLLRALERGGTGTIYVAEQLSVGRSVAVKVLRASLVGEDKVARRFEREAEIISRLEHANTLRLYDFGWLEDGRPYLVTELLQGETLGHRLLRGRLDMGEAVSVCCDILSALQEAHDQGIVHRDLKPSNVFLQTKDDGGFRVRVLDFGIARRIASTTLTEPGMIMGTPAYMSPEQSLKDYVDGRSDLYAVGAILFECLTGRPPFLAESAQTLILKHALMQAPRLNQVSHGFPAELDGVVAAMLSKTPELRPQSAQDALQILTPFAELKGLAPAGLRDPSFEAHYAPEVLTPSDLRSETRPVDGGRQAGVAILAGAGVLLLALAGLGALGRAMVSSPIDIRAQPSVEVEAVVVPAIPTPMLTPPGAPAPLWPEAPAVEEEAQAPDPARAAAPRTQRRPPPGFVDVRF